MERADRAGVGTFHVATLPLEASEHPLDETVAHHLRVRRIVPGTRIRLTDGVGRWGRGPIVAAERRSARVMIEELGETPAPPPLHLLAPVADRDRTLWLAEKATELGITDWWPVRWRRSQSVAARAEGEAFRQKLRGRMVAALEQSGGSWLPAIHSECTPEIAMAAMPTDPAARLVLDVAGAPLLGVSPAGGAVLLALGPEGGFEDAERELLRDAGFIAASLGTSTLRFETAGVAALALLCGVRYHQGLGTPAPNPRGGESGDSRQRA